MFRRRMCVWPTIRVFCSNATELAKAKGAVKAEFHVATFGISDIALCKTIDEVKSVALTNCTV